MPPRKEFLQTLALKPSPLLRRGAKNKAGRSSGCSSHTLTSSQGSIFSGKGGKWHSRLKLSHNNVEKNSDPANLSGFGALGLVVVWLQEGKVAGHGVEDLL